MSNNYSFSFNIENFKSTLSSVGGIVKPNKFMVSVFPPQGLSGDNNSTIATRNLQFFCTGSNLPGIELLTYDTRRFGYGVSEKKPWNAGFSPVRLNILLDASSYEWIFFKNWLSLIFNFDLEKGIYKQQVTDNGQPVSVENQVAYELSYKDQYCTDMVITSFRDNGEPIINTILRDAFPIGLSDIKLDWGDKDSYVQFTIYVIFTDWHISKTPVQEQQLTPS